MTTAKKNTPKVWDTPFLARPENTKDLNFKIEGERMAYLDKFYLYQPVTRGEAPDYIFFTYKSPERYKSNLPDIFKITGGIVIISEYFYNLLQKFDLGETKLFEVPLYERDQTTRRPERYFILHLVASKICFLPEHSKNVEEVNNSGNWMSYSGNDVLAVASDALEGVDLWVDPTIQRRIFFSDRLKIAIKEHEIRATRMKIRPVKVIE